MKRRIAVAAALAATLIGAAACGSSSGSSNNPSSAGKLTGSLKGAGKTVNAWIMADAQNPQWLPILTDAEARFKQETGADVKVTWTTWPNHLAQLDAALKAGNGPDVVELGNTEAPKYVFGGGLVDINSVKSKFDGNATWLDGLSGGCLQDGHYYCVPYYAGTKLSIYNTALWTAAGISSPPTTQADLLTDLDTLKAKNAANKNFVAFNMPGRYWYAAMSWVYTNGGVIADKGSDGKWKGELESDAAQTGLTQWQSVVKNYSTTTSATVNEQNQDTLFETGKVSMEYDAGWHSGAVQSVHTNPNDPNSADEGHGRQEQGRPVRDAGHQCLAAVQVVPRWFRARCDQGQQGPGACRRVHQVLHRHQVGDGAHRLGQPAEHHVAPERRQRQPGRRPAGLGRGAGVLVHPGQPELGERGEPAGAAGHVPGDRHRHRSEDGGCRCRREDQHHSQRVLTLR